MSSSFNAQYRAISVKFLKVTSREQILILVCGLILVILVSYTLLLEPLIAKTEKLQKSAQNITQNAQKLQLQIAMLSDKLKQDPNEPVKNRIEELNAQVQTIAKQLAAKTNNLVPAKKMANMLENVLSQSKGVKLIELQSIPPIPIITNQEDEQESGLYRHGVTLVVEGSYFDIQQYLEKLEGLPWQFYWNKFDYLVGDYPKASVELEIYTLSTNQAFIGI
jgi:MSHA biogenesis protein MshJ